jgi:hypothetical protein
MFQFGDGPLLPVIPAKAGIQLLLFLSDHALYNLGSVQEAALESNDKPGQLDKFKDAVRELGCADDSDRFEEWTGKLARAVRAIAVAAALLPFVAVAQGLPPLPQSLARVSAVSCIKIDETGAVSGAFLIASTGDAARDRDLIAWIRQLHWPAAKPGEKKRNAWFPMPIAMGGEPLLESPPACAPKAGS